MSCRIVNEVANSLFMGGRAMSLHSFNILLSVCEEKLHTCLDDTVIHPLTPRPTHMLVINGTMDAYASPLRNPACV